MDIQEKTAKFVSSAPPLRDADLEQINGLFRAYLFRIARILDHLLPKARRTP